MGRSWDKRDSGVDSSREIGFHTINREPSSSTPAAPRPLVRLAAHNFDPSVNVLNEFPKVLITREAYRDMCCIVSESGSNEVGWLGTVSEEGGVFTIESVFLPKQKVHGTTCEITPEGIGELSTELLSQPNGMDICNSIRFWGHVHPDNNTSPSGQDDDQMKLLAESCPNFFVRGILGKRGRMEFTIFWYERNLVFLDVPWGIKEDEDDLTERRQAWHNKVSANVSTITVTATRFVGRRKTKGGGRRIARNIPKLSEEDDVGDDTEVEKQDDGGTESSKASDDVSSSRRSLTSETATEIFNEFAERVERSTIWRILKWAGGVNLPRNVVSVVNATERDLRNSVPKPVADEETAIRENSGIVDEFLKQSGNLLDPELKREYFDVRRRLGSFQYDAFEIGKGEEDILKIRRFFDSLVKLMRERGHVKLIEEAIEDGFIPESVLEKA